MVHLARLLRRTGGLDEAESLLREAMRIRATLGSETSPAMLEIRDELILTLLQREKWSEAEAFARASLELYTKTLGAWHATVSYSKVQLGAAIAGAGRFEEAEPLMLDGWQSISADEELWPRTKELAADWIAELYEAWEKPDETAYWREIAAQYR